MKKMSLDSAKHNTDEYKHTGKLNITDTLLVDVSSREWCRPHTMVPGVHKFEKSFPNLKQGANSISSMFGEQS